VPSINGAQASNRWRRTNLRYFVTFTTSPWYAGENGGRHHPAGPASIIGMPFVAAPQRKSGT
jgi:hypothetical protein